MARVVRDLTITGPWGSNPARGVRLAGGFAPAYNVCNLVIIEPTRAPGYFDRQQVTVEIADGSGSKTTIFAGRVQAAYWVAAAESEVNAIYCEIDGDECTADRDYVGCARGAEPWETVFNAFGLPNCHPTTATFHRGPDAVYWTAERAMQNLRDTWMTRATWTLADSKLTDAALDRTIGMHLDLRGEQILAAYSAVLEQVGCRLAFRYSSGACVPYVVPPAGTGTFRVSYNKSAVRNDEAFGLVIGYDRRRSAPTLTAHTGPFRHETTYATTGANPLLAAGAASRDTGYKWQYAVQPANYAANQFAVTGVADDRPYPLLPQLVTRRSAAGAYHAAAAVTANPAIGEPVFPQETLAVYDTTAAVWKRITGGALLIMRPGADGAVLRLQKTITVLDTAGNEGTLNIDSAAPDVRFTAAALVDNSVDTETGNSAVSALDDEPDLAANLHWRLPGRRYNVTLPGATASSWTTQAAAVEIYDNPQAQLDDLQNSRYSANSARCHIAEAYLAILDREVPLGALLTVDSTPLNSSLAGDEVIVSYEWNLGDVEVRITAANSFDQVERRQSLEYNRIHKILRGLT